MTMPPAPGMVLHDDRRIAGDEAAEMPRHQPRRNVVDAARRGADQHGDVPALVELLDRLRVGAQRLRWQSSRRARQRGATCHDVM